MVLDELREKTKPYHQQIEKNELLSQLLGNITLDEYVKILIKFYGYYLPFETQLMPQFLLDHADLKLFYFPKLQYLKNDLSEFHPILSDVETCTLFPRTASYFGQLGMLYTLEGSCLGRAMLWPRLQKKLNLQTGGTFFSSASTDLRERWKKFCQEMVDQVKSESNKDDLINGSIATFISLDEWFSVPFRNR